MTSLKNIVFGCVSDHGSETAMKLSKAPLDKPQPLQRVRFGLPLEEAFKGSIIPAQLMDMLVLLARDGITTTDLFRRPGNPTDLKQIVKRLVDGRDIDYTNYNFYTLASVIKKFLLKIPGGVFGPEAENELLNVLNIKEPIHQFDAINRVIINLPKVSQELASMLFGTWFRMSHHSEFNSMSSESVAKSVAGSLFHTCADDPNMVNLASNVLQILIENFAASSVFGEENIEFFAQATRTQIDVMEKYRYELDTNFINMLGDARDNEERNGITTANKHSIPTIEECLALFERVVAHDIKARGIDPTAEAIATSQFSPENEMSLLKMPGPHVTFNNRTSMASSLPTPHLEKANITASSSPRSFQPAPVVRDPQDCTSLSSYLSAPDVYESMDQHQVPSSENMTKSLSRIESVYRKQLLRLRQRNIWFLNSAPTSTSMTSRFFGSPRHDQTTISNSADTTATSHMSSSFSCGILSCNTRAGNLASRAEDNLLKPDKQSFLSCSATVSSLNSSSNVIPSIHPPASTHSTCGCYPFKSSNLLVASKDGEFKSESSSAAASLPDADTPSSAGVASDDRRLLNSSPQRENPVSESGVSNSRRGTISIPIFTVTQAGSLSNSVHARCFKVVHHYGIVDSEDFKGQKSNEDQS